MLSEPLPVREVRRKGYWASKLAEAPKSPVARDRLNPGRPFLVTHITSGRSVELRVSSVVEAEREGARRWGCRTTQVMAYDLREVDRHEVLAPLPALLASPGKLVDALMGEAEALD